MPNVFHRDIKKGDKGIDVKFLKVVLSAWLRGDAIDSNSDEYDDATVKAVSDLQSDLGITPTGVFDAETRTAWGQAGVDVESLKI